MTSTEATPAEPAKPEPTVFGDPVQFDLSSFPCPRCQAVMAADSYGPCESCVTELRATQQNEATGDAAAAFEPKMNVTPNAVALKDD